VSVTVSGGSYTSPSRTLIHEGQWVRACHVADFDGIDLESRGPDQVVRLSIEVTAPGDPVPARRQPMAASEQS
jgi:hypothetical protein